jgi:hypothetical protein
MAAIKVQVANPGHVVYAQQICQLIEESAVSRGTGIAKRSPEYIASKIEGDQAIIALSEKGELAGFCYIESWSEKQYVANSGLIVNPDFRGLGLARKIKRKAFEHSRKKFPDAKLFGLTTSLPVMKINSELGYYPVTYSQLTTDETFWKGCQSCVNYEILQKKEKSNCMCTAMMYDPRSRQKKTWDFIKKSKIYERFMALKRKKLGKEIDKNQKK